MITKKEFIIHDSECNTKEEVFKKIINNLKNNEINIDENEVYKKLQEREEEASTGFEYGIAIPHAKIKNLSKPIITVIKTKDIDWESMDNKPANFIINILVPENSGDEHLKILSALTRKLIDTKFIEKLKSEDKEGVAKLINEIEVVDSTSHKISDNQISIVGVTSCPMGVAHTYMAAEKLEQEGIKKNINIKIETQGSIGVENELTQKDIEIADYVIIAADRKVELDRFVGKKVLETSTKQAIKNSDILLEDKSKYKILEGINTKSENTSGQSEIMKALMNGVSHMLPLVVVGGLFLGISLMFGGTATANGLEIDPNSFWFSIQNIGLIGFTLMIPILAGYIAYSIGDRPALAPGLIIGWIANDGSFYGSEASSGFLGAIVGALLVGYFVKYFSRLKLPKNIQSIMPILIIPLVTTFVTSVAFIFLLGKPIAFMFLQLQNWLSGFDSSQMIIMGLILGAMIAIDMGGPINKTAMLFAIGMISSGHPEFMGINGVAVAIPSMGAGIATMMRPKYYSQDEKGAGTASFIMGLVGITEGAIPFAAAHPKQFFPANIIGAMIGGAIAAFFGVTNVVPHGGIVIGFTGGVENVGIYFVAIIIGSLCTGLIANFLMSRKMRVK